MKKEYRFLFLLAAVKFILPFILQSNYYEPHRDEFLYLAEAHHLAWGYMEVPPLLSLFAWFTNFFGTSMFWLKFWPSLFGAFTYLVVGKIIISFGGRSWLCFSVSYPSFLALSLGYIFYSNQIFLKYFSGQ